MLFRKNPKKKSPDLSTNKREFLGKSKPIVSYSIEIRELDNIMLHMKEKYPDIKLLKSGDTKYGQTILKQSLRETLSKEASINEVCDIQKRLGNNKTIAYLCTSGKSHFEPLIIKKDFLIKPTTWGPQKNGADLNEGDFPGHVFYNTDDLPLYKKQGKNHIPHYAIPPLVLPQADDKSCGTLSLIYLKELLKNNEKQLNENSLRFSYFFGKDNLQHFFLPSPQTLRYSQSSAWNDTIKEMVKGKNEFIPIQNKKTGERFLLASVKKMLKDTIQIAKENIKAGETPEANQKIIDESKSILKTWPKFQKQWLRGYEIAKSQRAHMVRQNSPHNVYLTYKSHKLAEKGEAAPSVKKEKQNAALEPEKPRSPKL